MPHLNSPNSAISIESTSRISSSNKDPHTVDGILKDVVKPFGIWQFIVLMLSVWSYVPAAIFPIFGNSVPSKFHCQMEPNIHKMLLFDQTNATLTGLSLHRPKGPLEISDNKYGVPFDTVAAAIGPWGNQTATPGCHRYKRNYTRIGRLQELFWVTESTSVEACPQGYVYEMDKYQYPSSIVIEWDLVCDKEWLAPLSTSMYMLGMVPGFWIGGITADSIGRRATTFAFWVLQWPRANALLVLSVELTIVKYRFVVSSSMCIVQSSISRALATLAAYFIPYWRWLHLAIISPLALGIPQFWILPESPRWLLSKKRWNEAADVLYKGYLINTGGRYFCQGKKNRETTLEDFRKYLSLIIAEEEENEVSKETPQTYFYRFFDQLRQPYRTFHLAKVSLIATFLFGTQAACLFGMLLYARIVRGYVYLVALANNFTGIPGAVLSAVLYAKIRRRKLPLMMTYICAAFCLALGGICAAVKVPTDDIVLAVYSNLGLMLCTAISNMVFTYIPELFPSCIRSQGLGNAAGLGRFGAALGAFINSLDTSVAHGIPLLVYAGLLLLACLALVFLPDTTGENLEDRIVRGEREILISDI
ncbi:Solute carrier family 22 member [Echinococcus granulosus]|uniref:Solute carrier family 22 member n=1 Tax=Echinococcus granulosus TaxID=6210 RepID=W6UUU4_ECHGR|nr:Solute carrier family 22 member [Echinococcus granulosus]EUB64421.1 Solute carrier family 22 member [Echinococcus granulosus]